MRITLKSELWPVQISERNLCDQFERHQSKQLLCTDPVWIWAFTVWKLDSVQISERAVNRMVPICPKTVNFFSNSKQSTCEIQTHSVLGRSTLVPFPDIRFSKSVQNPNNLIRISDIYFCPKTKLKSCDEKLDHFIYNFLMILKSPKRPRFFLSKNRTLFRLDFGQKSCNFMSKTKQQFWRFPDFGRSDFGIPLYQNFYLLVYF